MENDHYVAFHTLAGLTGFGFAKRTSNLDRLLFHIYTRANQTTSIPFSSLHHVPAIF
jgi:hypothetical protein